MNKKILEAMGDMDDRFIAEAAPVETKKKNWLRWVAAAAACLVLMAGILAWPRAENPTGRYKYTVMQQTELALVLRWEDKTLNERYTQMTFDGQAFGIRNQLDESLVGTLLGVCQASGYDVYSDRIYTEEFAVFSITGQKEEVFLAVQMGAYYYVFFAENYENPATFGQILQDMDLQDVLPLTHFADDTGEEKAYYQMTDDSAIWSVLAKCGDAPLVEDPNFRVTDRAYISFTATSEALGVYKRALYITADGYLWSNLFDHAFLYHIGQKAAGQIIACAMENGTETEPEPYANSLAGTVTEIGDGYILIDDAILCWKEADGITFRVDADAPEFARWLQYYDLQVGDLVMIQYRGRVEPGNRITGAYAIHEAILADGHILVQE